MKRIIISLRHLTEQAKVHTIHHLTKQIKALKARKHSTDQQREQNERKVERFIKEIDILKKSSKDSIARWMLVNKKTFNEILKEETKTLKFDLEARVFSRISDHSSTRSLISNFRKKHDDWETSLPSLLSTLGKKRKKNTTKTKTSSEPDDDTELEKSEEEMEEESDYNSDDGPEGTDSEDLEEENQSDSEEIFVASLKAAIGNRGKTEKTLKEKKSEKLNPETAADRETGEGVVKYLDLNSMAELPQTNQDRQNKMSTSNSGKRSSFFVGGESDDENNDGEGSEDDSDDDDEDPMVMNVHRRIDKFKKQNYSKNDKKKSFPTKRKPQPTRDTFSKKPRYDAKADRKGKFEKKSVDRNTDSMKPPPSSVHPSWEAKQKQKASIQTFKGSKIVFDEAASGENVQPKQASKSSANVHPSWEAKQKQKPSIQTFKGSKIVFDD